MTEDQVVHTDSNIPQFEGQAVASTRAKVGATTFEIDDAVYSLDEVVRFVVEARVTNVNHVVNDTTGLLQRVHTLKAVEVQTLWAVDLTADAE